MTSSPIEQMQHLKELGIDDSKASVYWHNVALLCFLW